jgi:hypothetical protein
VSHCFIIDKIKYLMHITTDTCIDDAHYIGRNLGENNDDSFRAKRVFQY